MKLCFQNKNKDKSLSQEKAKFECFLKKKMKVFRKAFQFLNYYENNKQNMAQFNLTLPRHEDYQFMKTISK